MKIAAAVFVALALSSGAAQAATAPTLSNWTLTKTYGPDGPLTCMLRFPNAKGEALLALTLDEAKKSASFTLFGLPPYLAGKRGVIRGIEMAVGDWSQTGLKGTWIRGSDDTNSRLTFPLDASAASLAPHLARGKSLTVSFELSSGRHAFPFTLAGAAAPVAEAVACS
jgi:hypothetical protein